MGGPYSHMTPANFRTLICPYTKLLFVHQTRKHGEMAFLTSRSASKHDIFALGVDPTAQDPGKGGGSDLVSQATPFAVRDRPCSLATDTV